MPFSCWGTARCVPKHQGPGRPRRDRKKIAASRRAARQNRK